MEEKRIMQAPFTDEKIKSLKAGDMLYISGTIYTARDAAHNRWFTTPDHARQSPDSP